MGLPTKSVLLFIAYRKKCHSKSSLESQSFMAKKLKVAWPLSCNSPVPDSFCTLTVGNGCPKNIQAAIWAAIQAAIQAVIDVSKATMRMN